jgi:ABC-type bacteriocin/lantibiotic exporter with double-glycine peptidase domain
MNIVYYLLNKFYNEEQVNIFLMVFTSFIINIFQTNGISFITASIIESLQKDNIKRTQQFFIYFIGISIFYIFLYNIYKYFQNKILTKLRQWMRHQLITILLMVNNENFSEINFTQMNSPINRVSSVSFMVFNDIITYILPNITFLLIISGYFLYNNLILGTIFILGNIIVAIYLFLNWENMLQHNEEYEKYVNANESYLLEILNNIDKIIYRGQVNNEIKIFDDKTNKSIDIALKFYTNTNYHGIIMNIIVFIILFILIGYLIYLKFSNKLSITIFITFFTILLLYRDKMITIIQQVPDFIEFLGRSDSVLKHFNEMTNDFYSIMEQKYEDIDVPFNIIKFENVSFKYKTSDKYLFENLNLVLHTNNKIIGITGLSGNGKSTFVKMILKLYRCNSGKILIDGQDVENLDANYIRKHITYVNQSSKLFDKKVIDNILYACNNPEQCREHLKLILKYEKIKELYRNIDIYNKRSGSLGENLSGGQRQIINIIGGLINPSEILILDEPTNALDPELKRELLRLISDFKQYKKSIIIITHDRDVYPLFDETIQI